MGTQCPLLLAISKSKTFRKPRIDDLSYKRRRITSLNQYPLPDILTPPPCKLSPTITPCPTFPQGRSNVCTLVGEREGSKFGVFTFDYVHPNRPFLLQTSKGPYFSMKVK